MKDIPHTPLALEINMTNDNTLITKTEDRKRTKLFQFLIFHWLVP